MTAARGARATARQALLGAPGSAVGWLDPHGRAPPEVVAIGRTDDAGLGENGTARLHQRFAIGSEARRRRAQARRERKRALDPGRSGAGAGIRALARPEEP